MARSLYAPEAIPLKVSSADNARTLATYAANAARAAGQDPQKAYYDALRQAMAPQAAPQAAAIDPNSVWKAKRLLESLAGDPAFADRHYTPANMARATPQDILNEAAMVQFRKEQYAERKATADKTAQKTGAQRQLDGNITEAQGIQKKIDSTLAKITELSTPTTTDPKQVSAHAGQLARVAATALGKNPTDVNPSTGQTFLADATSHAQKEAEARAALQDKQNDTLAGLQLKQLDILQQSLGHNQAVSDHLQRNLGVVPSAPAAPAQTAAPPAAAAAVGGSKPTTPAPPAQTAAPPAAAAAVGGSNPPAQTAAQIAAAAAVGGSKPTTPAPHANANDAYYPNGNDPATTINGQGIRKPGADGAYVDTPENQRIDMARQTLTFQTAQEDKRQRSLDALNTPQPTFAPVTTPASPALTADLMTNTGALSPEAQLSPAATFNFVPESPEIAARRRSLEAGGPIGPDQMPAQNQQFPTGSIGIAQPNGEFHVIFPQTGFNAKPITMPFQNEQAARDYFTQKAAKEASAIKQAKDAQAESDIMTRPVGAGASRVFGFNTTPATTPPQTVPTTNATGTEIQPKTKLESDSAKLESLRAYFQKPWTERLADDLGFNTPSQPIKQRQM